MSEQSLDSVDPSDEDLIERVAQGDVAAFGELYDRYVRVIYVVAAHVLSVSEADDIVQDVFMRVWTRAYQFDAHKGAFVNWIMTIMRNRLRDQLKAQSVQKRVTAVYDIDELLVSAVPESQSLEEAAWLRERDQRVLKALQSLPQAQRQALLLAYFGDLSQSEIARELGLPIGTVKKRIQLGMQKLRRLLMGTRSIEPASSVSDSETGDFNE